MRIKKVSQTTSTQAQVVNGYSTSTTDSYSANYVNELNINSLKGEKGRILTSQMSSKSIGGSTGKEYSLTFTGTYTNIPTVIVSVWNNNAGSYGGVPCAVGEITTTTCSLYFMANVSASDIGIEYLVISND